MPTGKNKHWRLSMPGTRSWKITYWCPRANRWQLLLRRAELFPNPSRNLWFASLDGLNSKSTFSALPFQHETNVFQAPHFRSWLVLSEHGDLFSVFRHLEARSLPYLGSTLLGGKNCFE